MKPVLFCDFDGTITENDNIIQIMKHFQPTGWENIKNTVLSREVSVREGVGKIFSLLSSSEKNSIIEFVLSTASIREGFKEFVHYAKENGFPLYIVSGGIDFFVKPILKGIIQEDLIYCNSASFEGETIEILWPHSCDSNCQNDCGCCKPSIIRQLTEKNNEIIVIGDSVTDLEAAKLSDFVIARDYLLDNCRELSLRHESFTDFFDVMDILEKRRVLS
ncbi:2-hydroxy-3-keto-5-methylthiopentenyl-1-phosphate phosphatase [Metabacillus sp. RGM 3146]|uniref:2-hydroxy-3-keto-5-methylthiopentenyl-1- phosphate phosphatase n=1 Tax=Metabacillus sp. RGM 3146 TaxID=3401092 RepID=UPI003B9D1C28